MKSIKIIRINTFRNGDPNKLTIQGVWGGQLDIDFGKNNEKSSPVDGQGLKEIMAYLPPFVRNVILEPDGFLFNSTSSNSFKIYLLNRQNTIMDTLNPGRIGESDIWQCRVRPNIFRNVHKMIIY
jgi:hypothetical protein